VKEYEVAVVVDCGAVSRTVTTTECTEDGCVYQRILIDTEPEVAIGSCGARHPVRSDWICEGGAGHLAEEGKHWMLTEGCETWD
jgi:hypothetical protein